MIALIRQHKKILFIALALFLSFSLLYGGMAKKLESTSTRPFEYFDVFFDLDVPRVIKDITGFSVEHNSTQTHPLFVLLVNPLGTFLKNSSIPFVQGKEANAAIFINSMIGALNVAGAFLLFRLMASSIFKALLLALIFGFSMSQMFMSVVPETATLATLSLMGTYALFWWDLNRKHLATRWWVLAGVFTLGITVTNVMQTFICFCVTRIIKNKGSQRKTIAHIIKFVFFVLLITSALALSGKLFYPSYEFFLQPSTVTSKDIYIVPVLLQAPWKAGSELFKHVFLVNLISCMPPFPETESMAPYTTCSTTWNFSLVGKIALMMLGMLVLVHWKADSFKKFGGYYFGLGLCLLFNITLHSFFIGTGWSGQVEYFLFTGNFTLLVIVLFLTKYLFVKKKYAGYFLACLFIFLALNNFGVIGEIIKRYEHYPKAEEMESEWSEYLNEKKEYHRQLEEFKAEFGIESKHVSKNDFFLFGLGDRGKSIYREGIFHDFTNEDNFVATYKTEEIILPHKMTVINKTIQGVVYKIFEDEQGVHFHNGLELKTIASQPILFPDFSEFKYPAVMQVLFHEVLTNVVEGTLTANFLVQQELDPSEIINIYKVLDKTGHAYLIHRWLDELSVDRNDLMLLAQRSVPDLSDVQLGGQSYPLTLGNAADHSSVQSMNIIDESYIEKRMFAPHSGKAAEILLELFNEKNK